VRDGSQDAGELHVRHSLGLVTYGWDGDALCHADFMRGLRASGAHPGYSSDSVDGFRHPAQDLAGSLSGFVDGDHGGYSERAASGDAAT
jgi:hypothetical protein